VIALFVYFRAALGTVVADQIAMRGPAQIGAAVQINYAVGILVVKQSIYQRLSPDARAGFSGVTLSARPPFDPAGLPLLFRFTYACSRHLVCVVRDRLRMGCCVGFGMIQAWDVDPSKPWPDGWI
jgi:hypothetical protein